MNLLNVLPMNMHLHFHSFYEILSERNQDAKIILKRATVEIVIYVNIKHTSAIYASSMNSLSEPNQDALLSNLYVKTEKYFFPTHKYLQFLFVKNSSSLS